MNPRSLLRRRWPCAASQTAGRASGPSPLPLPPSSPPPRSSTVTICAHHQCFLGHCRPPPPTLGYFFSFFFHTFSMSRHRPGPCSQPIRALDCSPSKPANHVCSTISLLLPFGCSQPTVCYPHGGGLLQAGSELSFYCGCIRLLGSFYKVKTVLSVSCGSEDGLASLPQVGTCVSLLHRREVVISSAPPPPVPTAAPRALLSAPSFPPHRAASQATSVAPPWACFRQHAYALWTFPGTPGCSHRAAFLPACCQASHSLTRSTLASPPGRM